MKVVMRVPEEVGIARVVLYAVIDNSHRHTGNCRQIVAGELMGAAAGLAICHCETENGFYLFGCDEHWEPVTDTWHGSLEDAKEQAEFEYEGVSAAWQKPEE